MAVGSRYSIFMIYGVNVFLWFSPALGEDFLPGPVTARVIDVTDGDMVVVMAEP